MKFTLKSIAVLPFVNMSNDSDNEYFSDGITEEIINALTKIEGLKVIARTSSFAFKGKHVDLRKVGKLLDVASVLEGSVRKANNRVRITAQLIDTDNGAHYWSKRFDRELSDIFELQDEISLLIANEVRNNFGHFNIQEHLVKESTKNISAYELFLKGRYHQLLWTSDGIQTAISYYDQAIAQDPNFVRPYYANLQCYGLMAAWNFMPYDEGLEKARDNFRMAKELDTTLPEYPLSFVGRYFWGEWDFKLAHHYIEKVLAINPHHIDGLEAMAELFIANGFFKQAEFYANKLLEVDPLSANNHYTLAHIHYYQKDFKTALEHVTKALTINSDLELANHLQALCFIWLKRKDDLDAKSQNPSVFHLQQLLYKVLNENLKTLSQAVLDDWENTPEPISLLEPYKLYILANTEHKKQAFLRLKDLVSKRRGQIINYKQDPMLEALHQFEEFHSLHESNLSISDIEWPLKEQSESKPKIDEQELLELKTKLLSYIESEQAYLDAQLNLALVAEAIDLHPNKLSYLINEIMGVNFNEFVNQYRLNHFKSIAVNPKFEHITILGLAYDSGFNSKSVFNTFFKKMEGTTPSQWVKSQAANS